MRYVDQRVAEGASSIRPTCSARWSSPRRREVRVVILGQDPYHGSGQAQGLAFSVADGQKLPPSLRNMLQRGRGRHRHAVAMRGDLSDWARQGVLLLNTALTVEDGQPQSHAGRGWEALTDALLSHVGAQPEPVVFLLWGAAAQRKRALLERAPHRVLTANHPSPLSARRPPEPFIGCRHFSQVNALLPSCAPARRRSGGDAEGWHSLVCGRPSHWYCPARCHGPTRSIIPIDLVVLLVLNW